MLTKSIIEVVVFFRSDEDGMKRYEEFTADEFRGIFEQLEALRNGCEQALLLLERERFLADPECKVVRAVLRSAIDSSPASRRDSA